MMQIISYPVLGLSLFSWFGLLGFIFIILTGIFGYLFKKGKIKMSWHANSARAGMIFVLLHGLAGIYMMLVR